MRMMVKVLRIITVLSLCAAAYGQEKPSADALAARAVDVLGASAWSQARYFAFTFVVERDGKVVSQFPQRWDRLTGDYRVSGLDPIGNPFEVTMNVNTKKGRATSKGVPVTESGKIVDFLNSVGFRRYVNDTFWLLMPLRLTESGVKREYVGERSDSCGRVWDVVKLTFENGALIPGDAHWAWINRDSGIVEEWDMRLQTSERPTEIMFRDYRRVGGLYLPMRRDVKVGNQVIRFTDLQILPAPPKGAFN